MALLADIQRLEPGGRVKLYELDATAIGGELYRFHGYALGGPIWWQGNEYSPWPITAEGFACTASGAGAAPTLTVGNVGGFITALCLYLDDLVGAKVIRRQTLAHYLDAQNFDGGNPEADPLEELPPELWFIECRTGEDKATVSFELSSPTDYNGVQLPARQIVANVCSCLARGGYRGPYCGYNGPPVASEDDIITSDAALDRCGGRIRSCKLRFGEHGELPYGSFPAAGLIRS